MQVDHPHRHPRRTYRRPQSLNCRTLHTSITRDWHYGAVPNLSPPQNSLHRHHRPLARLSTTAHSTLSHKPIRIHHRLGLFLSSLYNRTTYAKRSKRTSQKVTREPRDLIQIPCTDPVLLTTTLSACLLTRVGPPSQRTSHLRSSRTFRYVLDPIIYSCAANFAICTYSTSSPQARQLLLSPPQHRPQTPSLPW